MIPAGRTGKNKSATLILLLLVVLQGCTTLVTDDVDTTRIFHTGETPENFEYAGNVTAELRCWNWLFLTGSEERWARIEHLAQTRAEELYGNDAIIKLELISGRWHPASLVMLFGLAGFVEETLIEASVWLPVPVPEPEAEPETVVRYRIVPGAEYTTPGEFTVADYRDRDMLEKELLESHEQGDISATDLEKKTAALPLEGMLLITYGRAELTNAISKWFTFTLEENGKQLFKKRGVEDIPYVYGTDQLWWNERSFRVDEEWDKELRLTIEDEYQDKTYLFRIIKEEM